MQQSHVKQGSFRIYNVADWGGIAGFERAFGLAGGIYIGRGSPLGNPFRIGQHGDRAEVIRKYRRWLWQQIQQRSGPAFELLASLRGDERLGCHCCPLPCHAAVVVAAWEWLQVNS